VGSCFHLNTVRDTSLPAPILGREGRFAPSFPGKEGGLGRLGKFDVSSIGFHPIYISHDLGHSGDETQYQSPPNKALYQIRSAD